MTCWFRRYFDRAGPPRQRLDSVHEATNWAPGRLDRTGLPKARPELFADGQLALRMGRRPLDAYLRARAPSQNGSATGPSRWRGPACGPSPVRARSLRCRPGGSCFDGRRRRYGAYRGGRGRPSLEGARLPPPMALSESRRTLDDAVRSLGRDVAAGPCVEHRHRAGKGTADRGACRERLGRSNLLSLSPRTVEMHVGRPLATLQCRSRAEAVRRAGELRLLS